MKAVGTGSASRDDPPPCPLDGLGVGSGPPLLDPIDLDRLGVPMLPGSRLSPCLSTVRGTRVAATDAPSAVREG